MKHDWEREFWAIVEDKGVGANVDFPLAMRDFIRDNFIPKAEVERVLREMKVEEKSEAIKKIDFLTYLQHRPTPEQLDEIGEDYARVIRNAALDDVRRALSK